MDERRQLEHIREFYDAEYYGATPGQHPLPWHCRLAAREMTRVAGGDVLDVACGTGVWLGHFAKMGARSVSGVDLSGRAIEACRATFPQGFFHTSPAETLPFADNSFDVVTCMGSLEHFIDKPEALREMVRVSRPGAQFLLLVPNAGFLSRRVGLYGGTHQVKVKEDVIALDAWAELFEAAGLSVHRRRRDLHPLSWRWITHGKWWTWPVRALQPMSLAAWPMAWQYQVYHYCGRTGE
jgi:SAM-dependent methyltransferase